MIPKKDKIITAAIDLFAEQGFHNTSTADIAKKSGVAQGTLFYHFKNKEGILFEVLRQVLEQTTAAYQSIDQDNNSGLDCIATLLRCEMAIVEQHRQKVMVLIRDMADKAHQPNTPGNELIEAFVTQKIELLSQLLRQGMADGSIRPLPILETACFIDATFYGVMHLDLLKPFPVPPLNEFAISLCLSALAPAPHPSYHL